jgi:hypothetical protein
VEKNMTDRHEHLDEGTIHAWLDGELPPDESAKVESQAAACAECAALVAEARGLVAASSRILSSLDAVPGGVIPGTDAGADQLAALRARRRETSRRWWNDRRVVAAASLVFVAGAASVVWRSADDEAGMTRVAQTTNAVQPEADSAIPPVTLPSAAPAPPPTVREAPARDAKVAAASPLRDSIVAVTRALDSASELKVTAPGASLARGAAVAANEARRTDSISMRTLQQADSLRLAPATVQRLAVENQAQQQGASAPKQEAFRQRAERARAVPPSALGVGARLGSVVTTGVAAPAADMAQSPGCYRLRLAGTQGGGAAIVPDSVRLLSETPRELNDTTWYRVRAAGWADTALVWRRVDSTTVELRSRLASTPLIVRFSIGGLPLPLAPEAGVRAAVAVRMLCPQ